MQVLRKFSKCVEKLFFHTLGKFLATLRVGSNPTADDHCQKYTIQRPLVLWMPPVSRSSPENSRPLGLLFSHNPNYGYPEFSGVPLKKSVIVMILVISTEQRALNHIPFFLYFTFLGK